MVKRELFCFANSFFLYLNNHYFCRMKLLYTLLIITFTSFTAFNQKNILCQSGQIIQIDAANNFLSTNAEALVAKFSSDDQHLKDLLVKLYDLEKVNRLKVATIDKEVAIMEYDMKRANASEQKTFKTKLASFKKDIKSLDDTEKIYVKDIKSVLKKDTKTVNQLLVKYQMLVQDGSMTDTITPVINNAATQTAPKDDYADDPVIPIIEKPTQPQLPNPVKAEVKKANLSKNKLPEDCTIEFNGKNSANKKQTTLGLARLLTYTPDKMKSYYKLSDFLTISAAFEKLDGKTYLNIEARFNSKDVMKSYGKIHKSDFLRVEFISGRKLFLTAVESSDPYLEKHTANSVYKAKYQIANKSDLDILQKEYVDKLGIMWSSGFEAYPVYDVDFFHRQLTCLKSAK
jgi:hypothetical protein